MRSAVQRQRDAIDIDKAIERQRKGHYLQIDDVTAENRGMLVHRRRNIPDIKKPGAHPLDVARAKLTIRMLKISHIFKYLHLPAQRFP